RRARGCLCRTPGNGEKIMNLTNQVAIISGGLGDIGTAVGLELAKHGADIAIGDILPAAKAKGHLKADEALGRKARYDRVDTSDDKGVARWVSNVEKSLGLATLIIPNAAMVHFKHLRNLKIQEWRREIDVNLTGSFNLAHSGATRLLAKKKP